MRRSLPLLVAFLLGSMPGPGAPRARADDEPEAPREVPVHVTAEVDARDLVALGRWKVRLTYAPDEDVGRPYRVVLRLLWRGDTLVDLTHAPEPPTALWRKGRPVTYELPLPVPEDAHVPPGTPLDLVLTFHDPEVDRDVPPCTDGRLWGDLQPLARLEMPDLGPLDDPDQVARVIEEAGARAKAGDKADAWRMLETGLRRAAEDATKTRFRDAIYALAPFQPEPMSLLEKQIVEGRIADERRRVLREAAGRCWDHGHLFAALRILESIGGTLAEQARQAVLGALSEAKRTEKDIQQIRLRILAKISDEDKAAAQKAVDTLAGPQLMEQADRWFKDAAYARARYVYRDLSLSGNHDLAAEARKRLDATEAAWLGATPPDEQKLVDEAVNQPAFDRLATVVTQKFIYIGPKKLVEGIPAESRLHYDVGYVFLTDLFGRVPNPAGDRITVFFKELWDFGGGQGGGKQIDIGRADPEKVGYRVDTGLHYHELTHCVDDTLPILEGWREGLANFGAAYLFEALDQKADELHAFKTNLEDFEKDYLGRDLAYWRIPRYGPSAGFFLFFEDKYESRPGGHDWKPYRQFFREYRASPVKDGREPCVIRSVAHYLVRAFGPGAFDDLMRFRLPLRPSDRDAVVAEDTAFRKGESELLRHADEFQTYDNSPIPRDLLARRLLLRAGQGAPSDEVRAAGRDLGIVYDWRVIGPFKSPGADPRAVVFPPEEEIDFQKEYPSQLNTCQWRKAEREGVVSIDDTGWVAFNFSYMDDTATYAWTTLTVDAATPAEVHVRADDDFTLFLNHRRVEGYRDRGPNGSDHVWWRGPFARVPDAMKIPVTLVPGRNELLLKVKNRFGAAGFVLAVSRPDGGPIAGLRSDVDPPAAKTIPAPPKRPWKGVVRQGFRSRSVGGKIRVTVGHFQVEHHCLVGTATDKGVAWRKYTVRPGFPKDSPSNLFWFKDRETEGMDEFRLRLGLVPRRGRAPKIAITFQGEGEKDGLSGWTLLLHPAGDKKVQARLERYDVLSYQTTAQALPAPAKGNENAPLPLELTYRGRRLTVTLAGVRLFHEVPIRPIPAHDRLGVSTWGPDTGIATMELER